MQPRRPSTLPSTQTLPPPPPPLAQVIVRKLTESDAAKAGVLQYADHIMDALLNVSACREASVHQDAMLAVVS